MIAVFLTTLLIRNDDDDDDEYDGGGVPCLNVLAPLLIESLGNSNNNNNNNDNNSIVYDLCTKKVDIGKLTGGPTELLYDRYKKCITQYLLDRVVPSLKAKQGEVLLMEAVQKWRDHEIVVKWMGRLYNYLVCVQASKHACAGGCIHTFLT